MKGAGVMGKDVQIVLTVTQEFATKVATLTRLVRARATDGTYDDYTEQVTGEQLIIDLAGEQIDAWISYYER
jgi:hypothetical protein